MKIAFVTTGLEPGRNGVGDYCRVLAEEFERQGHSSCLLSLNDNYITEPQSGPENVNCLRLPRNMAWKQKKLLASQFLASYSPDWVSLHFVGYGYHPKGIVGRNIRKILQGLLSAYRVHVMFHELWIGANTTASKKHRLIGSIQKTCALRLLKAIEPEVIDTSNPTYVELLRRNGIQAGLLPLFGNIHIVGANGDDWLLPKIFEQRSADEKCSRQDMWVFGLFGSLPPEWTPEPFFSELHEASLKLGKHVVICAIGNLGSGKPLWDEVASKYARQFTFLHLGKQPTEKISQFLHSIDFGIAGSPYELIGKSSCAAAMIDHGLPVIVNRDDYNLRGGSSIDISNDPLIYKFESLGLGDWLGDKPRRSPVHRLPKIANHLMERLHSTVN